MTQGKKNFLLAILLVTLPVAGIVIYSIISANSEKNSADLPVVDWEIYKGLSLETGVASEKLKGFDGIKIKSPGFMVPLEDNRNEVVEFLLVPTPQACIHVPPPPANQMVLIKMTGKPAKMAFGPIWVEGILRLSPGKHMYGQSSFQMLGERVLPYKTDD